MKGRYQNSKTTQRGLVRLRLRPDEGLQQVSEGAMALPEFENCPTSAR